MPQKRCSKQLGGAAQATFSTNCWQQIIPRPQQLPPQPAHSSPEVLGAAEIPSQRTHRTHTAFIVCARCMSQITGAP